MKKICVFFAVLAALIFVISCGSGSQKPEGGESEKNAGELGGECYGNGTCNEGLVCNTEKNLCVEDPENFTDSDSDKTDSGSDGKTDTESDSDSDNGDSQPDDADTSDSTTDTTPDGDDSAPDNSDSIDDTDDSDTTNDNSANLPECSPTSATPCIDSEALDADSEKAYLIWSGKSPERLRWIDALDYCNNLNEGGFNDWQIPSAAALKTLLRCELIPSSGEWGGSYSYYLCANGAKSNGENSKFEDIAFFWSSQQGYGVDFYNGKIPESKNIDENFDVRCVRKEITSRQTKCSGLPENAEWNNFSEITQTWDWGKITKTIVGGFGGMETIDVGTLAWTPSATESYSETPDSKACRYKCKENYHEYNKQCLNSCKDIVIENGSCTSECKCGCKAGYFWTETGASNFVDTGGDPDYHCVPCTAWEAFAEQLREGDKYCPGGDDLKGKNAYSQTEKCPAYTWVNDSLDDCICSYGESTPKEDCHPVSTRKKPLIISPKVNN
ncbi:DUF1566 domain-containing protein [bacterium]|nr:DUF1566 domain-containing protein [bacterium]